jgi:hypothetical protein
MKDPFQFAGSYIAGAYVSRSCPVSFVSGEAGNVYILIDHARCSAGYVYFFRLSVGSFPEIDRSIVPK